MGRPEDIFNARQQSERERSDRKNELRVLEDAAQEADELALPARVQVQVDFIDEDDGRLFQRVWAVGVADEELAGEVGEPYHQGLVAQAHVAQAHPGIEEQKLQAYLRFLRRAGGGYA